MQKSFYRQSITIAQEVHDGKTPLLNGYFSSDKPQTTGLPSIACCTGELFLSCNYFGDFIKKETGKTVQEYIQNKVTDVAKEKIFDMNKSVSEIAYDLGFKHLPGFTRLFKQKAGVTPIEFRNWQNTLFRHLK